MLFKMLQLLRRKSVGGFDHGNRLYRKDRDDQTTGRAAGMTGDDLIQPVFHPTAEVIHLGHQTMIICQRISHRLLNLQYDLAEMLILFHHPMGFHHLINREDLFDDRYDSPVGELGQGGFGELGHDLALVLDRT